MDPVDAVDGLMQYYGGLLGEKAGYFADAEISHTCPKLEAGAVVVEVVEEAAVHMDAGGWVAKLVDNLGE